MVAGVRATSPASSTASIVSGLPYASSAFPTPLQCAGSRPPTRVSPVAALRPLIFST